VIAATGQNRLWSFWQGIDFIDGALIHSIQNVDFLPPRFNLYSSSLVKTDFFPSPVHVRLGIELKLRTLTRTSRNQKG